MSLQPRDIGSIWTLLSQILAPSDIHERTSEPMYACLVSILTTVVRVRQDLVVVTLPHVSQLLRRLISALASPRPQLGSRQYLEVVNSLPCFVSPLSNGTGGLGVESARMLARLLSAFTTKPPKVTRGRAKEQTSLLRPFAHHAPSVLLAYLELLGSPLSFVSMDLRIALQPGMFALCAVCGDRGRDSVMAGAAGSSLGSSQQIALKSLWQEFEKQKYIGTG